MVMGAAIFEDDLLLAYAADDLPWAQRLASTLSSYGLSIVFDQSRPGEEVWANEARSLVTAQHLLVLWSERAASSDWILHAVNVFTRDRASVPDAPERRVVVINLGADNPALGSFECINDFRDPSIYGGGAAAVPAERWDHLARQIAAVLTGTPRAAAPPVQPETPDTAEMMAALREQVATKQDDPALTDELERRPFARVIAQRMDEIWKSRSSAERSSTGAFMLHIHGPWGSGKTSVLNFLRERLQEPHRADADRWVVVELNAWRSQHLRPPWWVLINAIYRQAAPQLDFGSGMMLRARWLMWRVRADWLPVMFAVVFTTAAVMLATGIVELPRATATAAAGASEGTAKAVEVALTIVATIFAAGAAVLAFSRTLVFGSARAAQMYADLRVDPLRPVIRLFERLVGAIGRPVAVFVDDLDRCEGKYVIELLEGMQTLFRDAPVTYVIAADRQWICSSFEKGYGDFRGKIGDPGRPLGYLFLEKVFQISAPLPQLAPLTRRSYWSGLLAGGTRDPQALAARRTAAEQAAAAATANLHTHEELEAKIDEARHDPLLEQAMRAAAAQQITSAKALHAAEHRLEQFEEHLEYNPRFMKRLVNAFGLNQANYLLNRNGQYVPFDLLARWTILELRWPLLPELLRTHPRAIAALVAGTPPREAGIPTELARLFTRDEVKAVVTGGTGGALPLTEETIRDLLGLGPIASSRSASAAARPS